MSAPESRKAQLDSAERERLEDVVVRMRERVEENVRFQLEQRGLDEPAAEPANESQPLVDAIELETVDDGSWAEAFEQYVTGVGYTIVNRLAALRCMEVRGFVDEEVTVFKETGLTPAAETLVHEEFLLEDEAIIQAYHDACDELAEEIEILFDRESAYSQVDPDDDTFEALCAMLDEVPDELWRADDVLGWVYEYYNHADLGEIRKRAHSGGGLRTGDIGVANQFYTPHWVVRMLTDNSLGKLYLESTGELPSVVERQEELSADERKHRPLSPDDTPGIAEFCTYLVPSAEEGAPTSFDHPAELQVIDPACGSGHFLLYAFDVLERIWRAETAVDHAEIPRKILEHNLYGVDLDMRACQLAAFNLYLKGRSRAEAEGADGFEMPGVGIVCADAAVAEIEGIEAVFDEVAGGDPKIESALRRILDAFEEVQGLGSLLDVRGTLGDLFEDDVDEESVQLTLSDDPREDHTLGQVLHSLREAVDDHYESDSFLAQDLRSFMRLLDVLSQEYDVALMNPPYGSGKRMPDEIQRYVDDHYDYYSEFYINFFEVCETLAAENGRIGMLVPWTLLFKRSFQAFREDFIGPDGAFDFLAEYGYGVLDNATVGTAGTVVRKTASSNAQGEFIRLHDVEKGRKESTFADVLSGVDDGVTRYYTVDLGEFASIPGTPIMYSIPAAVRELHDTEQKIDPGRANVDGTGIADAVQGLATGNNDRFVRKHWECAEAGFEPYAKGGTDAWVLPQLVTAVDWREDGARLKRAPGSVIRNEDFYMSEGLTWSYIKRTGRRFGYLPGSIFDVTGSMLFPNEGHSPWLVLTVLNSTIYHGLFLSITPERDWQIDVVGRIPWHEALEEVDELETIAKSQYAAFARERTSDPTHPLYVAAALVPHGDRDWFYTDTGQLARADLEVSRAEVEPQWSLTEAARAVQRRERETHREIERLSDRADALIADALGLPEGINDELRTEIFLRTSEEPEDRETPSPDSVPESPEQLDEQVRDLVHHFAMEAVREEPDGVLPVAGADEQATLLDRVVERFHDAYGEHAADRLVEVDGVLGAVSATDEAYPNLRAWLAEELFDHHVDRMEKTPIMWKLTTERLLADAEGEGFACFVDYQRLDSGLLDRLLNRYLEPRKAELRERRSAADRRRNDGSLGTSEQADAVEAFERYTSALEQIAAFEDVLQELGDRTERALADDHRERAAALAPRVAEFRRETETRLRALDELRERRSEEWFEETFSPTFWETVEQWRGEWLDALDALERACEAYAAPTDEPVEPHLADLFDYYNDRVKGSDHYSSTGVLFMTYYFEREGAAFLDADGEPKSGLEESGARLATLAADLDEYKQLAEGISDDCEALSNAVPSDWSERARAEITTAGYRPDRTHGVVINIAPLADAEIVPETVDDVL